MTAAPRTGALDKPTPRLALAAHGNVAINGSASADLPRSGPPRSRTPEAPALSQARRTLSGYVQSQAGLAAGVEKANRPVAKLNMQLSQAMAELAAAERVLARRAAAIAAAARQGDEVVLPPVSADSEAASATIEHSRRTVNALRLAIAECSADQARAVVAFEEAKARGAGPLLDVLVEEHGKCLAEWHARRDAAYDIEEKLLGLENAIGAHGRALQAEVPGAGIPWLQKLETLRTWIGVPHREIGAREISAAAGRWAGVLERLKSGDPNAVF